MVEITVTAYLTSDDLYELAGKAKRLEQQEKLGSDLTVGVWDSSTGNGLFTHIKFVVDQQRARTKGLMK